MTQPSVSRQTRAELAGSVGAGILGAGVGALLAEWTAGYALLLLALGALLHGWGMQEKHRLEAGMETPGWSTALYWSCWVVLATLALWIGLRTLGV